MITIAVSAIVSQVRSAIDELMVNDSNFLSQSTDEENLTNVIIDKIGYALQYVIENAPLEKLDSSMIGTLTAAEMAPGKFDLINIGTQQNPVYKGRLKLPDDLLHIIDARLSSWTHFPKPLSDSSQEAVMQQDEYARGSWDRPVNILTYDGADRCLDMYCAKIGSGTGIDTLKFTLIRKPTVTHYTSSNPSATVTVPSLLEAALIYQIAGMAMTAFREDVAASLFAIAQKHLETGELKNELNSQN